jgi:hypothetical protein
MQPFNCCTRGSEQYRTGLHQAVELVKVGCRSLKQRRYGLARRQRTALERRATVRMLDGPTRIRYWPLRCLAAKSIDQPSWWFVSCLLSSLSAVTMGLSEAETRQRKGNVDFALRKHAKVCSYLLFKAFQLPFS